MRKWNAILVAAAVVALAGCSMFESEEDIELSEVPKPALNTAKAAVPGICITEADRETDDGKVVYELEGEHDGKIYIIEVTKDGKLHDFRREDPEKD